MRSVDVTVHSRKFQFRRCGRMIAVGVVLGTAILFGILATRQGDRFWNKASEWLSLFNGF